MLKEIVNMKKICVQSGDYLRYETTIGELLLEFTETLHDNKNKFQMDKILIKTEL